MIDSIIIKYLQENRRLVIPKLGAFIVKDDNQTVIFSELLRGDDGILRGLIKAHGVGDIEAAGVIDRFVFEVRHTLDSNIPYKIKNWGTLRRDESGKIVFMSFRTPLEQPVQQRPTPIHTTHAAQPSHAVEPEKSSPATESFTTEPNLPKAAARRKPDMFMIVAIVVAVLAICAMLYGLLCNREESEPMPFPEIESVEEVQPSINPESATDEAPNK